MPWTYIPDDNEQPATQPGGPSGAEVNQAPLPQVDSPIASPSDPRITQEPQPYQVPQPTPAAVLPTTSGVRPNGAAPGHSVATSQSTGESGFSLGRNKAVKSTQSRLDQKQQSAYDQANANLGREQQAAAIANQFQQEAVAGQAKVMSEQESARASMYREQAKMQSMFAAAEATAADLARERTVAYRARYEQMAAAAAAMQVNPALKLSAGQGLGLAASLFAQGFLGAKGVPVADVRGMVSQMIDRSIANQEQQIAQGHQLAEDQKQLWMMARQEASDDGEARLRLRGLMLAQASTAMDAEMAKYNSRLATAKGQVASADLRAELNKTFGELTDRYFKQYMAQSGLELDRWKAEVAASQESQRIAIARKEADARLNAGKNDPMANVIFDTSKSGQGVAKWKALPGTEPKVLDELRTREAAQSSMNDRYREYEKLAKEAGEIYGGWGKAMANDAFKSQVIAFRNGLIADYSLAKTGKVANKEEQERNETRFPLNTWTSRDGEAKVRIMINDIMKEGIDATDRYIGSHAQAIPESQREMYGRAGTGQYARGENTEADIKRDHNAGPVNDFYSRRSEEARAPHSGIEDTRFNDPVGSKPWTDFIRGAAKQGTLGDIEPAMRDYGNRDTEAKLLKGVEPGYAKSMDYLYNDFVRKAKDPEQHDEALRAAETLRALAEDPKMGYKAYYAEHLLDLAGIPYESQFKPVESNTSEPAPIEQYSTEAPRRK